MSAWATALDLIGEVYMQMLVCQRCGAPVHWDGTGRVATCGHCGTEYLMHPQSRNAAETDGVGRDEVAVIPIRTGAHAGRTYARSFIPKGWTATAADPEMMPSILSPMTMRVRYTADNVSATISRTGCACYEHIDDTPANAQRQWQLQMPDCKRTASYRNAAAVCDMTVDGTGATCQLISHENDEDDLVRGLIDEMRANVAKGQASEFGYDYCRRTYRTVLQDGSELMRCVEALVDYVGIPPSSTEMQLFQQAQDILARTNPLGALGGMFGLGAGAGIPGMGGIEAPQTRYLWEVAFLLDVQAQPDAFESAQEAARLIRSSYEESPTFERVKAQLRDMLMQEQMRGAQAVNAAMSQMMRDNAAHWDRMNDIVRDTNDYTNNIMRDMIASNAASHDRVANLQSEMIREVNTYHANGGVVEASTMWDHVYQSADHPDWFVATEGFELRPGIDFEELPRTHGDY